MSERVEVNRLAQSLFEATQARRAIAPPTAVEPSLDIDTAYRIQAAGAELRVRHGERLIGYKLGLVSRAKQEAMGVAEPLWGRLTSAMVHDEEVPLDLATLIHPRVEHEIAFLVGSAIDGARATVPDVLAATRGVFPALEVLDSRYENFQFSLPDVIADNASSSRIVFGGQLLPADALDLQLEGVVLRRNGNVVQTAAGAAVAGHPAAAVSWLARQVGRIEAGSLVLSGGLTAPIELAPGDVVVAEYATLGGVTLICGALA
jgi:2-keto-4-pentenoate hydratase